MSAYDPKVTPWRISPADYAPVAPIERKVKFLLRYAILAPSSHNTQPWMFHVRGGEVRIYPDTSRWLRVCDPDQRELFISLGCALENLLIAAEYFGFGYEVRYGAGDDPDGAPAVVVTLAPGGRPTGLRGPELLDAIPQRMTNHKVCERREVPGQILERLRSTAPADGSVSLLLSCDEDLKRRVHDLVVDADALQFANAAWREELGAWIGQGVFGAPWLMAKLAQLAVKYVDLGRSTARRDVEILMSAPVFGVVEAPDLARATLLKIGQSFERLYLAATLNGLAIQPVSQIVQVPETRARLVELLAKPDAIPVQPFRLGFAAPEREHTPRRPLEEVLL